jgi:hypothetical protein
MPKLRLTLAFVLTILSCLDLSNLGALAESDQTVRPLKQSTVPERGLQVPFDLKTDPAVKFRGPDSRNFPEALAPIKSEHRPFFGLGITRPIETETGK